MSKSNILPVAGLAMVALGVYRYQPNLLDRFRPETQDQGLSRLGRECSALRLAIAKDTKALYRAQTHYVAARKRLPGAALGRLREPMYALRERVEKAKADLAVMEQRVALLTEDQRVVTEPPEGGFQ